MSWFVDPIAKAQENYDLGKRILVCIAGFVFLAQIVLFGIPIMFLAALKYLAGRVIRTSAAHWRMFPRAPALWSAVLRLSDMLIIGTRVKVDSVIPKARPGEYTLLLANHPTSPETAVAYYVNTRYFGRYFTGVITRGLRWTPLGAAFYLAGGAIFVNRNKKKAVTKKVDAGSDAKECITEALPRAWRPGTVLGIHIDQGRPYAKSLESDRERHGWTGTHIRMCKTGGLARILAYIDEHEIPVRVLNVTAGFGIVPATMSDWHAIVWRHYHVRAQEIPLSEIPRDPAQLQAWARRLCEEKDTLLRKWGNEAD